MARLLRFLLPCALCLLAWSGCASYQLGTSTPLAFRTLYVAPIVNEADLPQAVGLYSTELRSAFLRDGRVTLVNRAEEADAILKVTLQRYERVATSSREDDTRLARKFDLEVQAVATLSDTRSGKDLFAARPIRSVRQIYTTATAGTELSRQQQAEYTTQPLLARELATRTASAVLDTW